ncbi:hypothetical protein K1719_001470 [Acacia pycnantha]|nr:hypothetical protein K1719_001470 [Acacia pycnantha]
MSLFRLLRNCFGLKLKALFRLIASVGYCSSLLGQPFQIKSQMWHHADCILKKLKQIKSIDDVEGIEGLHNQRREWSEAQVTEYLVATFGDYFTDVKIICRANFGEEEDESNNASQSKYFA